MTRDTAVRLRNQQLYQDYMALVAQLQQEAGVLRSSDPGFDAKVKAYKKINRRHIVRLPIDPTDTPDFVDWLDQDENQGLPVFIWDRPFTPADYKTFEEDIKPQITAGTDLEVTLVGTHDDGPCNEPGYESNMVLLTVRNTGSVVRLQSIDWVVDAQKRCWLCRMKNSRTVKPFKMTPGLEAAIKEMAPIWYDERKTYLDTNDLRELADML